MSSHLCRQSRQNDVSFQFAPPEFTPSPTAEQAVPFRRLHPQGALRMFADGPQQAGEGRTDAHPAGDEVAPAR